MQLTEAEQYKSDIEHMQVKHIRIVRENEQLKQQLQQMKLLVMQLQQDKEFSAKDAQKLQIQQISDLQQQIILLTDMNFSLNTQLEQQNAESHAKFLDIQRVQKKYVDTINELEDMRQKMEEKKNNSDELCKQLRFQIQALNEDKKGLKEQIVGLNQKIIQLKMAVDLSMRKNKKVTEVKVEKKEEEIRGEQNNAIMTEERLNEVNNQ
ncbi:Hypothetical_protein [Hexamita inflata]|uniref:Hypothetical_protein n=1 Tax=Hexamita inflata TaxID=28002 RepID=A0AA86TXU6_9EUKA|nr:Hypothetical protein HINF_LOCUS20071 [Hexamita inflata]